MSGKIQLKISTCNVKGVSRYRKYVEARVRRISCTALRSDPVSNLDYLTTMCIATCSLSDLRYCVFKFTSHQNDYVIFVTLNCKVIFF